MNEPWDDIETHKRYYALLIQQVRSENARNALAYERLPWWKKLVTRKPQPHANGAYAPVRWVSKDEARVMLGDE